MQNYYETFSPDSNPAESQVCFTKADLAENNLQRMLQHERKKRKKLENKVETLTHEIFKLKLFYSCFQGNDIFQNYSMDNPFCNYSIPILDEPMRKGKKRHGHR